jgi:hypothetical protein
LRTKHLESVDEYLSRFPGLLHSSGEQILHGYLRERARAATGEATP